MSRLQDVILLGIRADQPAATVVSVGTLYYVTDESVLERSDGTNWEEYSDTSGGGITQLTGAVTAGPGSGSQAASIANDAITTLKILDKNVTYAKIQDISASLRIMCRKSGGSGVVEEGSLSEVLDFIGSAAQGDILYRGAATWAKLAAGTAAYVLQTGGAGADPSWVSPVTVVVGGGGVSTNFVAYDHAAILAANTTPQQVAAARAGKILRPIAFTSLKETTAGGYATNPSWRLRWAGIATDIITPSSITITAADKRMFEFVMVQLNITGISGGGAPINTALQVSGSVDTTSGNAANWIRFEVVYSDVADGP